MRRVLLLIPLVAACGSRTAPLLGTGAGGGEQGDGGLVEESSVPTEAGPPSTCQQGIVGHDYDGYCGSAPSTCGGYEYCLVGMGRQDFYPRTQCDVLVLTCGGKGTDTCACLFQEFMPPNGCGTYSCIDNPMGQAEVTCCNPP